MDNFEDKIKLSIGKNICEFRKMANMSQIEFAEKLNYSDKAISKWERGESLPDIIVLIKIADMFNISLNELIGYENSSKKKINPLKRLLQNKIIMMFVSVTMVWLVASIIFVFLKIFNVLNGYSWLAFIYALPVSFLIFTIYFIKLKHRLLAAIFESLLNWSFALSICLSINFKEIWLLFIIAVPLQVVIVLVNCLKRRKNKN